MPTPHALPLPKFIGEPMEIGVPRIAGRRAHDEVVKNPMLVVAQSELANIVTLAIRVGRGTAKLARLNAALEPFNIRRKA